MKSEVMLRFSFAIAEQDVEALAESKELMLRKWK